jgi:pyruvate,orthophosphate dikinase
VTEGTRLVFAFDHRHPVAATSLRHQLGGKGANLAEMTGPLGLPVPPGFTITTGACRSFLSDGWPAALDEQIDRALKDLEARTGRRLGDPIDPLLVSVRSGASVSMPGMLDTVLDLGMNAVVRQALSTRTGDDMFAWDCYRRFLTMYGQVVLGQDLPGPPAVDGSALRQYCEALLAQGPAEGRDIYPDDARAQLGAAIRAVFASWDAPRARAYRQHEGMDDTGGTAVNVQAMVYGNRDDRSGSGVAFTRDPTTGRRVPRGDFLWRAQGEDIVAGTHRTGGLETLAARLPDVHNQLVSAFDRLEEHFADVCDVEFTVESGRLWLLQVRRARRSGLGAIRLAVGLASQSGWAISRDEAVARITLADLDQAQQPEFGDQEEVLVVGEGASPGAAIGHVVFSADQALEQTEQGVAVILVRDETSPADVRGMQVAEGILTSRGGQVSHAAVVARGWGIAAVVGASIEVDTDSFSVGGTVVRAGDVISIDGTTGSVTLGARSMHAVQPGADLETLLSWADAIVDSDTPPAGRPERLLAAHQRMAERSDHDASVISTPEFPS